MEKFGQRKRWCIAFFVAGGVYFVHMGAVSKENMAAIMVYVILGDFTSITPRRLFMSPFIGLAYCLFRGARSRKM
jgi:uncharacterized protein YqgC (DUF456 family)